MTVRILQGDCREVLATLPDASVQMVCTSPPYFNQRDYGVAGQIGLEVTPIEYVDTIVQVFREVRRVLRPDGTVFLNLGDSYMPENRGENAKPRRDGPRHLQGDHMHSDLPTRRDQIVAMSASGLKRKDLIGIPWMTAFALRADGWYLRADNVWGKPNGMPESTKDRTTRSHEYVFLLSRSERYYYDHEAVRSAPKATTQTQLAKPYLGESTKDHTAHGVQDASDIKRRIVEKARKPASPKYIAVDGMNNPDIKARYYEKQSGHGRRHAGFNDRWDSAEQEGQIAEGGNLRSVWWISPAQSREGHFAVMPDQVAEICIRAGSSCGDTILDPFAGAFTTAMVADRLQRNAIGIELSQDYCEIARRRLVKDAGMFAELVAS
jgi:DNA modification methylase